MKKLRNKRVTKLTVKDLKDALKGKDDDSEVILGFYLKDKPNHFVYLADVLELKYDGVVKEKLFNSTIIELCGYDHDYCTYIQERKNDK